MTEPMDALLTGLERIQPDPLEMLIKTQQTINASWWRLNVEIPRQLKGGDDETILGRLECV